MESVSDSLSASDFSPLANLVNLTHLSIGVFMNFTSDCMINLKPMNQLKSLHLLQLSKFDGQGLDELNKETITEIIIDQATSKCKNSLVIIWTHQKL